MASETLGWRTAEALDRTRVRRENRKSASPSRGAEYRNQRDSGERDSTLHVDARRGCTKANRKPRPALARNDQAPRRIEADQSLRYLSVDAVQRVPTSRPVRDISRG